MYWCGENVHWEKNIHDYAKGQSTQKVSEPCTVTQKVSCMICLRMPQIDWNLVSSMGMGLLYDGMLQKVDTGSGGSGNKFQKRTEASGDGRGQAQKKFQRPPQVCAATQTKLIKKISVKSTLLPYIWEGKKKRKEKTIQFFNLAAFCKECVRTEWNGIDLSTSKCSTFVGSLFIEWCSRLIRLPFPLYNWELFWAGAVATWRGVGETFGEYALFTFVILYRLKSQFWYLKGHLGVFLLWGVGLSRAHIFQRLTGDSFKLVHSCQYSSCQFITNRQRLTW